MSRIRLIETFFHPYAIKFPVIYAIRSKVSILILLQTTVCSKCAYFRHKTIWNFVLSYLPHFDFSSNLFYFILHESVNPTCFISISYNQFFISVFFLSSMALIHLFTFSHFSSSSSMVLFVHIQSLTLFSHDLS